MTIKLEQSASWATYSTDPPKPVLSPQIFENLVRNKTVKSFEWDKSGSNSWVTLLFADKSRLIIGDDGDLIFVPDK